MMALAAAGLVLVLILSWQAVTSAHQHRRMAEEVLQDYAELAADEFVRRSASQVGYYGFYPVATSLQTHLAVPEATLAGARAALEEGEQGNLVARVFRATDVDDLELSPPDAELQAWLSPRLVAAGSTGDTPFRVLHGEVAGRHRRVVYGIQDRGIVGFEADLPALEEPLRVAFDRAPLLPASLGPREGDRQVLQVRVLDPSGQPILTTGATLTPTLYPEPHLTVEVPYGDSYQSVLEGYRVSVTLDPSAVDTLVIGGLPASRLPLLVGLAVLAMLFLLATVVAARKVQQVARLRTDFIARVSHELRTPLTQIRIFAETLLLDRARDAPTRQRALKIIDREARRLSHLVDNILLFSRRDRQDGEQLSALHLRREMIRPLLRQILEQIRPMVVDPTLTVEDRLTDTIEARVDGEALHRILLNLLDNALKYGPKDQHLHWLWESKNGTICLSLTDQGPGIPHKHRQRIWQDFERLDRAVEAAVAGTGIGLSVVRELVEQQGGKVWVEDGDGGGSRFVVELPVSAAEETG